MDITVRMPEPSATAASSGTSDGDPGVGTGVPTEIRELGFTIGTEDVHVFHLDVYVPYPDVVWSWSQSDGGDVITERTNDVFLVLSCFDIEVVGTITITATVGDTVLTLEFDP